jgi:hypothetical protein
MVKSNFFKLSRYLFLALTLKFIIWICETTDWWPRIDNPGIIIGVVGFGIAILLGAKLSVVNGRLYSIEDAVCRIVGAMRILRNKGNVGHEVETWSRKFEATLRDPKKSEIINLRSKTEIFIRKLVKEGYDGPNLSGFSRDVSYILHRSTAEIPFAYEYFSNITTLLYTITIAVVTTGIAGFIAIFIVVFVLAGAAILIEDMDHPLDYNNFSMITVNLEPLTHFNAGEVEPAEEQ